MTKLELIVSAQTLECVSYDELTAKVLGLLLPSEPGYENLTKPHISHLLADESQMREFQSSVQKLTSQQDLSVSHFETLNLVFSAPNAPDTALQSDRSPLGGVYSNSMKAMHDSDHLHLSCFTHIQHDAMDNVFRISALEYSRNHRSQLIRQVFASWLVELQVENAVIATRADGTVVFWNQFATSVYQYLPEEALGREIRTLISSKMSLEQGNEMMERMARGEHFKAMYLCSRKDQSEVMVHTTLTPIADDAGEIQFIVAVSADYSVLHNTLLRLDDLNVDLENEVVARTEQLLAQEKTLRMIGAAMKESDTGVLVTDQDYKITWCNDAVSRMVGLKKKVILGMFPWELPLQQEQKQDMHRVDSRNNLLVSDEIPSTLESYFLQEKAFRDSSGAVLKSEDRAADSKEKGRSTDTPRADMMSASTTEGSNEEDVEPSLIVTSPKRPPVAAICYQVNNPCHPLNVMVSVQVVPGEKTEVTPASIASFTRRRLQDAVVLALREDSYIPWTPRFHPSSQSDEISSQQGESASAPKSPGMQFMIKLRDITADRKAEEAQLMAERASAASEAKTQMMQMLSHELRTPLQGIMGVASTSMMDIEDNDISNDGDESLSSGGSSGVKGSMYESLSTILASSRLLLTLINNTLDARKINADMMLKIEMSTVPLICCIRDSFQYCGPFATINEAVLELAHPSGQNVTMQQILQSNASTHDLMNDLLKKQFNVVGNRLRLEQVIVNLLSNSIKYTTPGTSVVASVRNSTPRQVLEEIRAAPSSSLKFLSAEEMSELLEETSMNTGGGVTIFSVRDHGKGIPPEEVGKVFGEFQQLESAAEKDNKYDGSGSGQSSGSGLGLNLSMKFVTLMQGHIWFQNCTDGAGGVTFSFYLRNARPQKADSKPSLLDEEAGNSSKGRPLMNESGHAASGFGGDEQERHEETASRIRALVVDDSMINLKVLARMLTKLKVQHCQIALSGAAALEYLEPIRNDPSLVPNLILCDLQMPGMDGYELMCHLREMDICSSPIVMACSADWSSETEGKCNDVGFDGLLRKPITVTHLKEFLSKCKL